MRYLLPLLLVLPLLSGCVTRRDQVAVVRGVKFCQAEGSPLGQAVGAELAQVGADIGAVKLDSAGNMLPADVDPAQVPLTIEAASENAAGIAVDRANRERVTGFLGDLGKELLSRLPWGSAALAAAGAAWALLRKRATQAALAGMVNAGMDLRDQAASGKVLSVDTLKSVYAFWNQASGARAEVETALAKAKEAWEGAKKPAQPQE